MSQNFQDRLARLEEKHGKPSTPSQVPEAPLQPERKPRQDSGSMIKPILLGAAILVLLPVTAVIGTVVYSNMGGTLSAATHTAAAETEDMGGVENLSAGARAMAIAYGPAINDPERQAARKKVDSVMFKFQTGTMTEEEAKYWTSPEGQMELAEAQKVALNVEGLRELGKELYLNEK